jgi:hypothetical protein
MLQPLLDALDPVFQALDLRAEDLRRPLISE